MGFFLASTWSFPAISSKVNRFRMQCKIVFTWNDEHWLPEAPRPPPFAHYPQCAVHAFQRCRCFCPSVPFPCMQVNDAMNPIDPLSNLSTSTHPRECRRRTSAPSSAQNSPAEESPIPTPPTQTVNQTSCLVQSATSSSNPNHSGKAI